MSLMPKFALKMPLAQALLVLSVMRCLALALARCFLPGGVRLADFAPAPLTRHCSGSTSPPTEFQS